MKLNHTIFFLDPWGSVTSKSFQSKLHSWLWNNICMSGQCSCIIAGGTSTTKPFPHIDEYESPASENPYNPIDGVSYAQDRN